MSAQGRQTHFPSPTKVTENQLCSKGNQTRHRVIVSFDPVGTVFDHLTRLLDLYNVKATAGREACVGRSPCMLSSKSRCTCGLAGLPGTGEEPRLAIRAQSHCSPLRAQRPDVPLRAARQPPA